MSAIFAALAIYVARRTGGPAALRGRPSIASAIVACGLGGMAIAFPPGAAFWAKLHGTRPDRVVFGEDGAGVSVIRREPGLGERYVVFVNGLGQSTLPYGEIHTALGAVPAFVHPAPKNAAVIGLGSGDTVHAVAGRLDLSSITCIEIIRPQLDTLVQLGRRSGYGGLHSLLSNPRIEHIAGDGRIHLMRSGRYYDIIEADALRPGSAYAGNLYSEEYFRLVLARLTNNGLAATWAPTTRVRNSFAKVFPYVLVLPGMLVGSKAPIDLDRRAIAARVSDPLVLDYYRAAGIDIERLLDEFLGSPTYYTPADERDGSLDVNTDLFPKDEYDLAFPRR
jgi:spermidine synthase